MTRSGVTAHRVSKNRPAVPILALTREPNVARQLNLWWGVLPIVADLPQVTADTSGAVDEALMEKGLVRRGDRIVLVGSSPFTARAPTNFLKVHRVGAHV